MARAGRLFDDPATWKAWGWSLPFSAAMGIIVLFASWQRGVIIAFALALLTFLGLSALITATGYLFGHYSAIAGASFLLPSGRSTRSEPDLSYEKALLAGGKVQEAIAALTDRLREDPENANACILAADIYAREGANPHKAATLYRRAKHARTRTAAHDLYATNRLIDLYLGVLDNESRARAELQYIVETYAGTRQAEQARQALARMG